MLQIPSIAIQENEDLAIFSKRRQLFTCRHCQTSQNTAMRTSNIARISTCYSETNEVAIDCSRQTLQSGCEDRWLKSCLGRNSFFWKWQHTVWPVGVMFQRQRAKYRCRCPGAHFKWAHMLNKINTFETLTERVNSVLSGWTAGACSSCALLLFAQTKHGSERHFKTSLWHFVASWFFYKRVI